MRGYRVPRKAGWDTHGLPVELEVERRLGINGKKQIEDFGIARVQRACAARACSPTWRSGSASPSASASGSTSATRTTRSPTTTSRPCGGCCKQHLGQGPALRGLQGGALLPALRHGHLEPRGRAGLQGRHRADACTCASRWPPTAAEQVAGKAGVAGLAGGLDHHAVDAHHQRRLRRAPRRRLRAGREPRRALRAGRATWSRRCSARGAVVERELPGAELLGLEYEPPFRFVPPDKRAHYVVGGDFVTTTDGTGIVHIAPAFGEDDMRVGLENDLPLVNAGRHARAGSSAEVTPWAGRFVKDADPAIIADLQASAACCSAWSPTSTATPSAGAATRRCSTTPRRPGTSARRRSRTSSWPPTTTVVWHPDAHQARPLRRVAGRTTSTGRSSRDRYWGTPLPVWRCEQGHTPLRGQRGRAARARP